MHKIVKFSTTERLRIVVTTPLNKRQCYEIMQLTNIVQENKKSCAEPTSDK